MSGLVLVRLATAADVKACVELIEERRRRYERYQPRFWKKSRASAEVSHSWYGQLFVASDAIALVATEGSAIVGFVIAKSFPAPPVYNPGGPNALIDDFAVSPGRWMEIGPVLLSETRKALRARGYVQIVVVGAPQDEEKSSFLAGTDLSIASTWWTAGT